MLMNLLIFLSVFGGFLWFVVGPGASRRKQMEKRIARMKGRKSTPQKSLQEMSLRRKQHETKGLIHWLAKPLPDFKRLGDRLERAGKTITPKQYVLRRLMTMLIITGIIGGV